jgi:hypothetical protein
MERSRSVSIPLSQSRSVPFTLQPNKKQNRSVPDYQTQNRAAPFLKSEMERLRSTWLLNQTLRKETGRVQLASTAPDKDLPEQPSVVSIKTHKDYLASLVTARSNIDDECKLLDGL